MQSSSLSQDWGEKIKSRASSRSHSRATSSSEGLQCTHENNWRRLILLSVELYLDFEILEE